LKSILNTLSKVFFPSLLLYKNLTFTFTISYLTYSYHASRQHGICCGPAFIYPLFLFVFLSQTSVLSKWLNIGSRKEHWTID